VNAPRELYRIIRSDIDAPLFSYLGCRRTIDSEVGPLSNVQRGLVEESDLAYHHMAWQAGVGL